ncbi:MAG: S26 family signal peptidase [Hyphomonas sp.]|nr:S26 family signal peptidase [Hyphomonas sp.]
MVIGSIASLACLSALVWEPQERLIWNRTESAPVGLYWLSDDPFTHGRWVVVSARSKAAQWAQTHGFIGKDWPMIKQIAGVSGDEICRHGTTISINSIAVAKALTVSHSSLELPVWKGCQTLNEGEVFLLNSHPRSLDGRYFGVTKVSDLDGVAIRLFEGRSE